MHFHTIQVSKGPYKRFSCSEFGNICFQLHCNRSIISDLFRCSERICHDFDFRKSGT